MSWGKSTIVLCETLRRNEKIQTQVSGFFISSIAAFSVGENERVSSRAPWWTYPSLRSRFNKKSLVRVLRNQPILGPLSLPRKTV